MKILQIITSLKFGGAEKLMVDVIPRMRERGNDVELLSFIEEKTPFYSLLKEAGVPVHFLGKSKNVYNPLY